MYISNLVSGMTFISYAQSKDWKATFGAGNSKCLTRISRIGYGRTYV